jgi:YfiH family protein
MLSRGDTMPTGTVALARRSRDGVAWYDFPGLTAGGSVRALVSTRTGGVSRDGFASLNLSLSVGDDSRHVTENRRRLITALDLTDVAHVAVAQVHGRQVLVADEQLAELPADVLPEADGLVTDHPGVALWLRFADCVPLLACDPRRGAVGVAHAGWRGTFADVVGALVEALATSYGSDPADLRLAIGPAIGPCCYQVGADLAAAFHRAWPVDAAIAREAADGWYLDLPELNRRQALRAGVRPEHLFAAATCTACHPHDFFSHRAQRGQAGRFAAVVVRTR